MITVLLVIPSLNEAKNIENTIRSLLVGHTSSSIEVDTVVADGGSSDKTKEIVDDLRRDLVRLSLIHNPGRYQSAAVNLAVSSATREYKYLVRCDAHASYPPHFIELLVKTAEDTGADSVVVPMDSRGYGCFQRAVSCASDTIVGSGGSKHRGGQYSGWIEHGHHALFLMRTFCALGGYNSSLSHVEDVEYDARLIEFGGKIYMDAGNRITYFPRNSPRGLARQYFNYGRGRAITALKFPRSMKLRQIAIAFHTPAIAIGFLLVPVNVYFLTYPAFYTLILLFLSTYCTFKLRSRCGMGGGLAALIMHLSWGVGFWGQVLAYQGAALAMSAKR